MTIIDCIRHKHRPTKNIYGLVPFSYPMFPKNYSKYSGWICMDKIMLKCINYIDTSDLPILYLNIRNGMPPSFEQMDKAIEFIRKYKDNGDILVSCKYGHGRTGCVLAVWSYINGVNEPIEYIRDKYCKCVLTNIIQRRFVKKYISGVYNE